MDDDLPYGVQVVYEDGGPQFQRHLYFPHFHYQAGAVLTDYDYNLLTEYWGTDETSLADLEVELEAVEKLAEEGAVDDISKLDLD